MVQLTTENLRVRNPLIDLWSLVRDVIQKNVVDLNSKRGADTNVKVRNWIFPEFAEKNDEKFPRATIKFGSLSRLPYAGNDFVAEIRDDNNVYQGDWKGTSLSIPVRVGIFVKRDHMVKVEDNHNTVINMRNDKFADHLAWLISTAIRSNKADFIAERFNITDEISVTPAYENNTYSFVADLEFTITTLDVWSEMVDADSLITQFELFLTTTTECT